MTETDLDGLRARTRALCAQFPDEYWRETDRNRRYPQEFVDTLTGAGLLAALIPTEYGGLGLGLTQASVIMEEINKSGGHSAACHAQMYTMGALLRHGSDQQKNTYLPLIAKGELRLQAFSITEPDAGSDTTSIITTAEPRRRRLRDHRAQELDQPHPRVRPRPGAGPDQPQDRRPDPRADPVPGRPAPGPRRAARHARGHARCGRCSTTRPTRCTTTGMRVPADDRHRRGRRGLPLRHRRLERRAHPARRRGHRRRLLVRRPRRPLRQPARGVRPSRSAPTRASSSRWPTPT